MSRFSIILSFVCIALAGLAFIPLLPIKLEPSYSLPRLSVSYNLPGHASRVVEIEVTSRLEAMLARIKNIKEIRSTSGNGWGRITIELDKHANVDVARFEASTIVRQTWPSLPDGLSYPTIEMSRPGDNESRFFMSYTINAPSSPILIQQFAENNIKPRLAGLQGIYKVDITGATPMEWQLEYDSRQLASLGITVEQLRSAISRYYSKESLGVAQAEEGGNWIRLALVPSGETTEAFDPSLITVAAADGSLVRLDRLLKVKRDEEAPTSYYRINGLNSIYLFVTANEAANQLELSNRVMEEMKTIRSMLPPGYEIHTSYDATNFIREELRKIYIRTAMTIAILLIFVLIMTRSWRYLTLIVSSLAVNMCISFIFYYLLKLEMQLYSLAGITISLSLIIDNTIVMSDHIRKKHNRNAFLPILAATLTTVFALSVIFFLDEEIRLNLQDFAAVVIINLMVSLGVALFFIPALQPVLMGDNNNKVKEAKHGRFHYRLRRLTVYSGRAYLWLIAFTCRWKKTVCGFLILAFGLPVFMLPEKIEMKSTNKYSHIDSVFIEKYNKAMANATYRDKVKPITDVALGGALRLFVNKVYEGSYFTRREETVLTVTASMPNGTTLAQMDALIRRMEAFISLYSDDVRQFQTQIYDPRRAKIDVLFTKQAERSGFPFVLKSRIVSKAIELGGGSWAVYGLPDRGFSNDVREMAGNYRVELLGYNYDELYQYAEAFRDSLMANRRIKEVFIYHEFSYWKDDYREFYFNLDKKNLSTGNIRPIELFSTLFPVFGRNIYAGSIVVDNSSERLRLSSRQSSDYDVWSLLNMPIMSPQRGYPYTVGSLASVGKESAPQNVSKINQQYVLCVQYEYVGTNSQGTRILDRMLETFNSTLPLGYSGRSNLGYYYWGSGKSNSQYLLILLIIVIIYFSGSILFNSLRQPPAIIFVIPVSYIGVFLTFYLFRLNFDQGGFASFILLCGITINASIYILNEYNTIRRRKPLMSLPRAYLKAWNTKLSPVFLTIVSSVLGFIPFMTGAERESFWFPLAAGSIGGLIMSFVGVFVFLPLFTLGKSGRRTVGK